MNVLIRVIAIIIEVAILVGIAYAILNSLRLAIFNAGIGSKYHQAITGALLIIGVIITVFFIAHLVTFYPPGPPGF